MGDQAQNRSDKQRATHVNEEEYHVTRRRHCAHRREPRDQKRQLHRWPPWLASDRPHLGRP